MGCGASALLPARDRSIVLRYIKLTTAVFSTGSYKEPTEKQKRVKTSDSLLLFCSIPGEFQVFGSRS